jgi:hypothetical protein
VSLLLSMQISDGISHRQFRENHPYPYIKNKHTPCGGRRFCRIVTAGGVHTITRFFQSSVRQAISRFGPD